MSRNITSKLIEMAEEGAVNWQGIARECLARMSEDDVVDMVREMEWDDCWEDDEEENEDEEDNGDLQRQAHVKLVDGREFAFWVYHEIFDAGDDVENLRTHIIDCLLKLQVDAKAIVGFEIINETALCEWLGFDIA